MTTGSLVGADDGPPRLVAAAFLALAAPDFPVPPLPVPAVRFPLLLADRLDPPRPPAEPLPPRPALPPFRLLPDRLPDVRPLDPVPRAEPRLAAPPGGTLGRITSDDSSL